MKTCTWCGEKHSGKCEEEIETYNIVEKLLENIKNNICPECNNHIESKFQNGACVYASPCNHRLYQGTIMESI